MKISSLFTFEVHSPKCDLSTWEKIFDLYALPILVTLVAVIYLIILSSSSYLHMDVRRKPIPILIASLIMLFSVYVIDRGIEEWRNDHRCTCH